MRRYDRDQKLAQSGTFEARRTSVKRYKLMPLLMAVYTGNSFAVPSTPLASTPNTQLLLRASTGTHGTLGLGSLQCGSNVIVDASQNNYNPASTTVNVVASDLTPYLGQSQCGSVMYTGNTSYLIYNSNLCPALNANIWTSDYTLECWVNPATISTANTWNIFGRGRVESLGLGWQVNVYANARPHFWYYANSSSVVLTSNTAIQANVFTHVAVSYAQSTSTLAMYVNGLPVAQSPVPISGNYTNTHDIVVGCQSWFTTGYLSTTNPPMSVTDLRIQQGLASYTGNTGIVVPTAPLQATPQTQLLLRSQRAVNITNNQGAGNTQMTLASPVQFAGPVRMGTNIQTAPVYGLYNMASITVSTSGVTNWPLTLSQGNIPVGSGLPVVPFTGMYSFQINMWGSASNFLELYISTNGNTSTRIVNYINNGAVLSLSRFVMGGSVYLVAGDSFTFGVSVNASTTLSQGGGPAFALFLLQRNSNLYPPIL